MRNSKFVRGALILAVLAWATGCSDMPAENLGTSEEVAQQVGDVMASIDESGGSGGSIASSDWGAAKTLARLEKRTLITSMITSMIASIENLGIKEASAATCWGGTWIGSCTGTTLVRNFANCTVGSAVFSGTVTLVWTGGTGCALGGNGSSITRIPNFTVTGRRNATLSVTKTGTGGQVITKTASGFDFTNDGIRRAFRTAAGDTQFDFTTQTTSAIAITGAVRTNRVLNGGGLRVTNNLTSETCTFVPSSVTWNRATCNCPVSGSWSGSCSDGKSTTLTLTGCGTGSIQMGDTSASVVFDRCGGT